MSIRSKSEYDRQLNWRVKQIEIGKAMPAYTRYTTEVPKQKRRRDQPGTPDPYDARMSKRQYEGRVKAWKRSFHEMYTSSNQISSPPDTRNVLVCNFFLRDGEAETYRGRLTGLSHVLLRSSQADDVWNKQESAGRVVEPDWICTHV